MTPPPAAAATAPSTAPGTAPARRPVGPRRVSGPARRPAAPVPPLRRVVDHPLLDRLIRGRAWIGIVAFALIGIVTMQVALLKLNAGIGRSVERAATLQRSNSLLSAQVSALQAENLQQAETAGQGMVYDPPGDVRYLRAGKGDAAAAAATMVGPGQATPPTSATSGQSTGSGQASSSQTSATSGQTSASSGQTSASSGQTSSSADTGQSVQTTAGSAVAGGQPNQAATAVSPPTPSGSSSAAPGGPAAPAAGSSAVVAPGGAGTGTGNRSTGGVDGGAVAGG